MTVHPISCDAAQLGPDVESGPEAKFSITYCTALLVYHGRPVRADFDTVDAATRELAERVEARMDEALSESEAQLRWHEPDGRDIDIMTKAAVGSPQQPMDEHQLRDKLADLGAGHLPTLFDDLEAPASRLVRLLDV